MFIRATNSNYSSSFSCAYIDEEERAIIKRLRAYGITPTGKKTADKARLHEIELKEAEQLDFISQKFLTVSPGEQAKIQEKKKQKAKQNNPEKYQNNFQGAQKLGEQIYFAIKWKNKKN